MLVRYFILISLCFFAPVCLKAQDVNADSLNATKALKEIFAICRSVNFADPKVIEQGLFYKAAPYIIYRGADKTREWKDFANYKNLDERKGVDDICLRINGTVNRDINYKIQKYFTEKESEGTWHVLLVSYDKKGVTKKAVFAFLKIGDRFGLGDID